MSDMASDSIVEAAGLLLVTFQQHKNLPDQFLLMRHEDRWDLPKGLCESSESHIETALRETEEETGIAATDIQVLQDFTFSLEYQASYSAPTPITIRKRATYFLGALSAPVEICCSEHMGYQWFRWDAPHKIQSQTIDPLLAAADQYFVRFRMGSSA